MDNILCFIKFARREFADKLIKEGQIYFNLPSAFNLMTDAERADENEGAEWIDNSKIAIVKADHPTLGKFDFIPSTHSPSKITQYNYYYLTFSLYAIMTDFFDKVEAYQIDSRLSEFGDTAIIIEEPYVFLNSIITELKSKNLKYEINQVNYRDLANGRVDLNPFDKKIEHQHQCEFRIIIENTDDFTKTIEIGSIEQYSKLVNSKYITECIWTVDRTPTISK